MSDLIDIGVNLGHRSFASDRDAVIARARNAAVCQMVVTGTSLAHSREALALAQQDKYKGVLFSTAGVHPHEAARCDAQTLRELRQLLQHPEVVAVGECGLDFNRNFSPRPVQESVFSAQLELAIACRKPLFLHERDAHARFVGLLDECRAERERQGIGAVVHCFTGSAQALTDYVARGCHIGITGWICDERRGLELQRLVKHIPLDRLLLETDAPFLMPRDLSPKLADGRNEPSTLPHIARTVARCMDLPIEKVMTATTANARRFFGLSAC